MSLQPRRSSMSKSRVSSDAHHTDVLRDVLNKRFNEGEEAPELEKKMGFNPVIRSHGSKSSQKTVVCSSLNDPYSLFYL